MQDSIVNIKNSKIQHGRENDRIYLIHLEKEDMPQILDDLDLLANKEGYSKIFAKVPSSAASSFSGMGYLSEASIPGFFSGREECVFMSKYLDKSRNLQVDKELNDRVLDAAFLKKLKCQFSSCANKPALSDDFSFKMAKPSDAPQMANLYSNVFDSYPFPVFDPDYIKATMNENLVYFGIWKGDEIVALSSCEMDQEQLNVEMTDFAVLPQYRGHDFSLFLLNKMEGHMKKRRFKTAYTIARSSSYGMNSTFAKCGYTFTGRLVKNTQICGKIEDMNVWYKRL